MNLVADGGINMQPGERCHIGCWLDAVIMDGWDPFNRALQLMNQFGEGQQRSYVLSTYNMSPSTNLPTHSESEALIPPPDLDDNEDI